MAAYEKDYSKKIEELCENRLFGFQSKQEEAQLIADIISNLSREKDMTISRAEAILSDAIKLLPHLSIIWGLSYLKTLVAYQLS